ncbi:MAG: helix-turn-helix domain-containing protein [Burkholderiales bacterium]|jgi:cytoskeleton protein RodZ|nr:helix-turn-helix domain-containing protein [Burkholderiales bacterium]
MSEVDSRHGADGEALIPSQTNAVKTAGAILREARQAQGLHIAALAASIKVAQKKLESLEGDRFDELPDATFTRALAQTVCRAMKIDPAPVLALLPAASGYRLEHIDEGINAPFRDRPGRREPSDWTGVGKPAVWGVLLILVATGVVYFVPSGWLASLQSLQGPQAASAPAGADSSPAGMKSVMMAPPPPVVETTLTPTGNAASAPAVSSSSASAPTSSIASPDIVVPMAANAAGTEKARATAAALQIHAKESSWIEVRDARANLLIARTVQAGETVAVDGDAPLRLKIGNARTTKVSYRGQPLDLAANTQNNVARFELK